VTLLPLTVLRFEAEFSSELSDNIYQLTRRHIPEDGNVYGTRDVKSKTNVNIKINFNLEQVTEAKMGNRGVSLFFLQPRH